MRSLRNILIVHPYGLGDLLFVTPILRSLRLIPTVEKVDLLLGSRTAGMIRSNPHVDEIFVLDKDRIHRQTWKENLSYLGSLGQKLKKNHYDLMLDYSLRREYAFWGRWFAGIKRQAGFNFKNRAFFHSHQLPLDKGFANRHVAEYYKDLAKCVGINVVTSHLELYLTDEMRNFARGSLHEEGVRYGGPYIVVAPGGGESWGEDAGLKRWPVQYFAELIAYLGEHLDSPQVLIIGSEGERSLGEELKQKVGKSCINFAGKLSLSASAALLEKAQLFLGNDGGLVHIAHALRTPVIALYGPVNPEEYGPYPKSEAALAIDNPKGECSSCYTRFRYNKNCKAIKKLSVQFAIDQIKKNHFCELIKNKSGLLKG